MKNILILFFSAIFFCTCQQNEPTNNQTATIPEVTEASPKVSSIVPSFIIDSFKDKMENPKSNISLDMDGKKIEVTEDVVACEKIAEADYKNFQIPETAVDACGGWWAGGGNYYYIIKNEKSNYWMVMQAFVDEGQTGNAYNYESIMNITHKLK